AHSRCWGSVGIRVERKTSADVATLLRSAKKKRLLRCGRVGTHAIERRGSVGIALCSTSTAGFPALHLSATFGHGPLVAPGLESAVLRCARQFILVVVLVTVLHAFREFAVAGCLVAFDIEKLGCGSRLHFYPGDF